MPNVFTKRNVSPKMIIEACSKVGGKTSSQQQKYYNGNLWDFT